MKFKYLIALVTALSVSTVFAENTNVSIQVDASKKAEIEQKIAQYQKESENIIRQAEADITKAEKTFAKAKSDMERVMAKSKATIEKAQADAQRAKETFEQIQAETNAQIEDANNRMKQASQKLNEQLDALKKSVE